MYGWTQASRSMAWNVIKWYGRKVEDLVPAMNKCGRCIVPSTRLTQVMTMKVKCVSLWVLMYIDWGNLDNVVFGVEVIFVKYV